MNRSYFNGTLSVFENVTKCPGPDPKLWYIHRLFQLISVYYVEYIYLCTQEEGNKMLFTYIVFVYFKQWNTGTGLWICYACSFGVFAVESNFVM